MPHRLLCADGSFPGYSRAARRSGDGHLGHVCPSQVSTMGVAHFMLEGVEADDVIATLAVRAVEAGMHVDIASPDKVCSLQHKVCFGAAISGLRVAVCIMPCAWHAGALRDSAWPGLQQHSLCAVKLGSAHGAPAALMTVLFRRQDFFQLLRPGLQLLRPIKKDDVTVGREQRAGMVAYTEARCAANA